MSHFFDANRYFIPARMVREFPEIKQRYSTTKEDYLTFIIIIELRKHLD